MSAVAAAAQAAAVAQAVDVRTDAAPRHNSVCTQSKAISSHHKHKIPSIKFETRASTWLKIGNKELLVVLAIVEYVSLLKIGKGN